MPSRYEDLINRMRAAQVADDQGQSSELPLPRAGWETTPFGKVMRALGTPERIATKYLTLPISKQLFPQARARLEALNTEGLTGDTYFGDVFKAVNPQAGRIESGIAGMVGGALTDPFSYLGIGGLTQAGRAMSLGERASTLAGQAARGQRDLIRLTNPLNWADHATILPGEKFYKALDVVRGGKVARKTLGQLGPGYMKAAEKLDKFLNSTGRLFGVNNIDPWFNQRMKVLFGAIHGSKETRTADILFSYETDPARYLLRVREDILEGMATRTGLKRQAIEAQLNPLLDELVETKTHILRRDPKNPKRFNFIQVPTGQEVETVIKNWPLPPSFGGPSSPFDTEMMKTLREFRVLALRQSANITKYQQDNLWHNLQLWSSQNYFERIMSPEMHDAFQSAVGHHFVLRGIGSGGKAASAQLQRLTRRLRVVNGDEVEKLIASGALPRQVKFKHRGQRIRFDLHKSLRKSAGGVPTAKAYKAMSKLIGAKGSQLNAENVGRLMPSMNADQASQWVRDFGLGPIKPGVVQNAFVTDPLTLLTHRGMAADRAVLSAQWFKEVLERKTDDGIPLAIPLKDVAKYKQALPDVDKYVTVPGVPELAGRVFDPDLARHLVDMQHADIYTTEHLHQAFRALRTSTQWFKGHVLSLFLPYHVRNQAQDIYQYSLASRSDPLSMAKGLMDSGKIVANVGLGKDMDIDLGAHGVMKAHEFVKKLTQQGALGGQFTSPDDPMSMQKIIQSFRRFGPKTVEPTVIKEFRKEGFFKRWGGLYPTGDSAHAIANGLSEHIGKDSKWVQLGFEVGRGMSDQIRMAHIINRLRAGDSFDTAIMSMKKYFYDYHDLSPFERDVLRTVFPFYAWSRKNIPFYMEATLTHSGKLARINSTLQSAFGQGAPEESMLSNWQLRGVPVPVKRNKESGRMEYFLLNGWLGAADIQNVWDMWHWARTSLNPFFRVPWETLSNYNMFTERQIDRMSKSILEGGKVFDVGERQTYMKIPGVPNKIAHILSSFRGTNELHKFLDNPNEVSLANRVLQFSLGKVYPLDPVRGYYDLVKDLEELELSYKRSVRSAIFRKEKASELSRLADKYLKEYQKRAQGITPELMGE